MRHEHKLQIRKKDVFSLSSEECSLLRTCPTSYAILHRGKLKSRVKPDTVLSSVKGVNLEQLSLLPSLGISLLFWK